MAEAMTWSAATRFMGAIAIAAIVIAPSAASAAARASSPHPLTFVSPKALSLTSDAKTVRATVTVRNNGQAVAGIRFTTVPDNGNVQVKVVGGVTSLPAFTVRQFTLRLIQPNPQKAYTGLLVVSSPGAVPDTLPLELRPGSSVPLWLYVVIFFPLFAGLSISLWAFESQSSKDSKLSSPMGSPEWDFSKSWASNITVIGALLGTIISAGVLPAQTALPKATYAGLNLFFGALILVAPFVYTATQKEVSPDRPRRPQEPRYEGRVYWFVAASGLTLGAVLGELATIFLLFREIQTGGSMPQAAIWFLAAVISGTCVLACLYGFRSIRATLKNQSEQRQRQQSTDKQLGGTAREAGLPSWSIL
jgi:hypothetical protein